MPYHRFHVQGMTPELRGRLEAHRVAFALRSESEAVRHLIETSAVTGKRADISPSQYPEAWTFGGGGGAPAIPPTVTIGPSKPIPGSRLKKGKTK